MSESIILFVASRSAFDAALADVLRRSELFDQGDDDAPALIAEGYTRNLFIGEGPEVIGEIVSDDDVTEDDLRDEFEATLGVRDPLCLWVRYGEVELMKRFLWLLLSRIPAVVDNDFGLRAPGTDFVKRMRSQPQWNLTDP